MNAWMFSDPDIHLEFNDHFITVEKGDIPYYIIYRYKDKFKENWNKVTAFDTLMKAIQFVELEYTPT